MQGGFCSTRCLLQGVSRARPLLRGRNEITDVYDKKRTLQPSRRRGMSLIYMAVAVPVLAGFCSLAVDWARVQLVKSELQAAADAAARYAVTGLADGTY